MTDLIDKLSKTCENCRFRGTLSFNYPCCDCLEPERDNCGTFDGNLTGCVVFTKFMPIDATCVPKDKIHRYLYKLKEKELITSYNMQTMYMDGKPYAIDISLYRGEYVYSRMFSNPYDENLVMEILAAGLMRLYREMADELMKKIKEDKE